MMKTLFATIALCCFLTSCSKAQEPTGKLASEDAKAGGTTEPVDPPGDKSNKMSPSQKIAGLAGSFDKLSHDLANYTEQLQKANEIAAAGKIMAASVSAHALATELTALSVIEAMRDFSSNATKTDALAASANKMISEEVAAFGHQLEVIIDTDKRFQPTLKEWPGMLKDASQLLSNRANNLATPPPAQK